MKTSSTDLSGNSSKSQTFNGHSCTVAGAKHASEAARMLFANHALLPLTLLQRGPYPQRFRHNGGAMERAMAAAEQHARVHQHFFECCETESLRRFDLDVADPDLPMFAGMRFRGNQLRTTGSRHNERRQLDMMAIR